MTPRPPWLRRLGADRLRGAGPLARQTAAGLISTLPDLPGKDLESFRADLLRLARRVRASQPAMAPLFHLMNDVLQAAGDAATRREAVSRGRAAARRFLARQRSLEAGAVRRALCRVPAGATVMTHSASSLVEAVLLRAGGRRRGARPATLARVICTESRPAGEGSRLARRLARSGVPVTLVTDAAAAETLAEADLLLVGADCVTQKGLIHKVGTNALAAAAKRLGIPCHAVATSHKLLPERLLLPGWNESRGAGEVLRSAPPGLTVLNRPFDRTPWRRLTSVITEAGPLRRPDVCRLLREMAPARGWK
ncbi:MAG: hypothetical protein ACE5IM_08790 [Nitrospinota bacterium]